MIKVKMKALESSQSEPSQMVIYLVISKSLSLTQHDLLWIEFEPILTLSKLPAIHKETMWCIMQYLRKVSSGFHVFNLFDI